MMWRCWRWQKYVTIHGSIQMYVVHSVDTSLIGANESAHNISFQCVRQKLTPLRSKEKQSNTGVDASNVKPFDGFYDDLYDHRPESPLRYEDLVLDVDDSDDPAYNPDVDNKDTYGGGLVGFVNKDVVCRDDGVDIDVEMDELQDPVIGSNSDTSDDESREVRQNLKLWNTSFMEIVAGLQKEAGERRNTSFMEICVYFHFPVL
ncbi:hypothetical protein RND81_12G006900 [Saponaria officinalis]|uniref:Uncharacterized protein n=1 Tax=Saponaria officinalis TaxID=3572 RepID=A0AAW1H3V4_SAPOF